MTLLAPCAPVPASHQYSLHLQDLVIARAVVRFIVPELYNVLPCAHLVSLRLEAQGFAAGGHGRQEVAVARSAAHRTAGHHTAGGGGGGGNGRGGGNPAASDTVYR